MAKRPLQQQQPPLIDTATGQLSERAKKLRAQRNDVMKEIRRLWNKRNDITERLLVELGGDEDEEFCQLEV